MYIRLYTDADYMVLASWWKAAGQCIPPADIIPPTTYVGYIGDIPALSVCLYLTNSSVAWVDNLVGNPDVDKGKRKDLLKYGLEVINDIAKENGAKYLWIYTSIPQLVKYYEEIGFRSLDGNLQCMARSI